MAGCVQTDVATWENCGCVPAGLLGYNAGDPNAGAITAAVLQSRPPSAPSGYNVVCEGMLRAGGLCYWKTNPGDCGAPQMIPGITSGQIVGLSGQAASGVTGALGVAGVIGGAATLGISAAVTVAVGAIEAVFSHHATAVANEQATICAVAGYFNAAKARIDNAVMLGAISPDAGVTYLRQVANQAKTGLASIQKTCDAACVYSAVIQAFINYSVTWYDSIAPTTVIQAQAPGGPPTTWGTPPGGVTTAPAAPAPPPPIRSLPENTYAPAGPSATGQTAPLITSNNQLPGNPTASDNLNLGYNQQTGQSAQVADVPPFNIDWTMVGAVVSIIALVLVLRKGGE